LKKSAWPIGWLRDPVEFPVAVEQSELVGLLSLAATGGCLVGIRHQCDMWLHRVDLEHFVVFPVFCGLCAEWQLGDGEREEEGVSGFTVSHGELGGGHVIAGSCYG
jgi:hypothetical protein